MRTQSANLKKNVKEKILKAAKQLFAEKCFSDVSILSITKKACVSNGSFYRYFSSKKDILREIVEEALNRLDNSLKVRGKCLESKLIRLIEDYLYFIEDNFLLCRVLHEAEYIETSILKNLKRIFIKKLTEIGFNVSDTLFWFFWGSLRFFAIWSYFWKKKIINENDFKDLIDFIFYGIDTNKHKLDLKVFDVAINPVELEQDTTKMKILQSAEKLFGTLGYKKTQISDITKNAGFAQGTFYLYFEAKQDVLKELVIRTNKAFRKTLKNVISNFKDRRDAEIAGYYAFLKFFRMHPYMYKIVREAEFVVPETGLWYYERIHQSYLKPLRESINKGQIRSFEPENLAVFLMGVGHFMGMELIVFEKHSEEDFKRFLMELSPILYKGIKGG